MGLFDEGDTAHPQVDARPWLPLALSNCRAARKIADYSLGGCPQIVLYQQAERQPGGHSKAASSARSALRRACGYSGFGDPTRNQTLSPLSGRKSRADKGIGSLRKVPWVLSLSGALWVPFSRQREKGTKEMGYSQLPINCNLRIIPPVSPPVTAPSRP